MTINTSRRQLVFCYAYNKKYLSIKVALTYKISQRLEKGRFCDVDKEWTRFT